MIIQVDTSSSALLAVLCYAYCRSRAAYVTFAVACGLSSDTVLRSVVDGDLKCNKVGHV